jgi:hypothetical protein
MRLLSASRLTAARIGFLVDTIAVKDPATVYADLLRDLREV